MEEKKMLKKNDEPLRNPTEKVPAKRKKGILIAGGAILLIFIIFIIISSGGSTDYVSTVKNGYLGEYTDVTVSELLEDYYGASYDDLKWEGGTTDDGEHIVAFYAESETMEPTKFQFKMYDDEIFKVNAFVGDGIGTVESDGTSPTDIAAFLNFLYQYNKIQNDHNEEQLEKLNEQMSQISGSSILYGASEHYSGDRSNLCEIYGDAPLDMSAQELLDYYLGE